MSEYSKIRGLFRLGKMLGFMVCSAIDGAIRRPRTLEERCEWRRKWARVGVSILGMQIRMEGPQPQDGLIVCNHLSYVDVLVLGAVLPAVFVSKAEVTKWPLVGLLTDRAGTIYLQRNSVRATAEVNRAIASSLMTDVPVVIFPEGTTTAGDNLLPFHAALFEPAIRSQSPVWPAALSYEFKGGGSANAKVAYWGDDVFFPHLVRLARLRDIVVNVRFASEPITAERRSDAANESWKSVARLMLRHDGKSTPGRSSAAVQATVA